MISRRNISTAFALVALATATCAFAAEPTAWPTYRGNTARTGNIDGKDGPTTAKVLWVHATKDQFVAAPAIGDKALYLPAIGSFNTPFFHALSLDPAATQRVLWSAKPPAVRQVIVSSPAIVGDDLIFGDGQHLTDGAVMRAISAVDGFPVWELSVPGELVHIEGSVSVADGKVYFGAGHGGVYCVDPATLILDGKEQPRAEALAKVQAQWKQLLAKYEEQKKKDPDFAVRPTPDALPKAAPKVVWQKGAGEWHVDAPVTVADGRVLVSSAFLDKEQKGRRSLFALKVGDGALDWELPLNSNPWGGASIAGDKALVGCSTVGMYLSLIGAAKGEVIATNLSDGKVAWRKPVKGGVVSPIAVKDNLAIFTATDGKVRAFDLATGGSKWLYDGGAPFFAGVAVTGGGGGTGGTVYAADIRGVIHAIKLADGSPVWKLDLVADATVKLGAGSRVYGSPIVHAGRLYVATCNIESNDPGQQVIVCIGEK